jgi:hypothetical protein
MGVSDYPLEATAAAVAALLDDLAAAPERLAARLSGLDATALRAQPAAGEWSALAVLAHLRASGDILMPRLYQILVRDDPPLPAFDERGWAEVAGFVDSPLDLVLTSFSARRAELVRLLCGLDLATWRRTGQHEVQGRLTLWQIACHLARHEAEHLAQLERALAAPL